MKEYRVLKFLDLFRRIFERLGVDYEAMRKILEVKLLLDSRRKSTVNLNNNSSQNREQDKDKNQFLRGLPIYIFFGLPLIFFVLMEDNFLFSMSSIFGLFMFFMITALISDFSSVLLDVRDKNIILTKPVNSTTVSVARVVHIIIYVSFITGALTLPSLLVSLFSKGIYFSLLYLFSIILIDLFIIVFTALLYLVILKLFDGEKLKDTINYVQIALTIVISISYQLVGRLFDISQLLEIKFSPTWWSIFLPPIWFASVFEFLFSRNREMTIILYSILSLLIPIASIIVYVKLTPAFERNLQKLNEEDSNTKKKNKFIHRVGNLVCRTKEERSFFQFSSNLMKSERNFKLRVYPNLGFSIVFPFLMILSFDSKSVLGIYFIGIAYTQIIQFIEYSDGYKGAWIYSFFSLDENKVYKATLKSIYINLITPVFLLVSIGFLFITRENIVLDLIIAYISLYLGLYFSFKTGKRALPFSQEFGVVKERGSIAEVIVLFFIIGGLALLHFLSGAVIYGKYIYLSIILISTIICEKRGFKTNNIDTYSTI